MGYIKFSLLFFRRHQIRTVVIITIAFVLFLCQLIGLCLYGVAKYGEKRAFRYNGFALYIVQPNVDKKSSIEKIKQIRHVLGVNESASFKVQLKSGEIVKEAKGNAVIEKEVFTPWKKNSVIFVAERDVKMDHWFFWEKGVSMLAGEYPNKDNKGILIESRLAKKNRLLCGDWITFNINGIDCSLCICGIYKVKSEFIITKENEYGEAVFVFSPYNRVFGDFETIFEKKLIETAPRNGITVFVDSIEHVAGVKEKIQKIVGDKIEIYNNADSYLESSTGIVVMVKNYATFILGYILVLGVILLLIVYTYYAIQFRFETGVFLALGFTKITMMVQYFIITIITLLISLGIGFVVYCGCGKRMVTILNERVEEEFEKTCISSKSQGSYETPELEQGFSLEISRNNILSIQNFWFLIGEVMGIGMFITLIPVYNVIHTKPTYLLKEM